MTKKISQSSNFEEVVKKSLISEQKKLDESGNWASGDNSGQIPGTAGLSAANKGNSMPPFLSYQKDMETYATSTDMKDLGPSDRDHAPKQLPYPMQTIIDFIADSYTNLMQAESLIYATYRNPTLKEAKIKKLKEVHNTVKSVLGNIRKIVGDIDKNLRLD